MGKSKKESKTLIPKEKRSSTSKISINCKKTSSISLRQSNGSLSPIIPCEPIMFGICTIDFLPLLFGKILLQYLCTMYLVSKFHETITFLVLAITQFTNKIPNIVLCYLTNKGQFHYQIWGISNIKRLTTDIWHN